MRIRRFPIRFGARLAVGFLAAVYLWNLKVVFLHDSSWNPLFSVVHTTIPSANEEPTDESIGIEANEQLSLQFKTPELINITLPPPEQRVPNFIILGAQKAGTQALRTYLSQHPLVYINSRVIEPHFFDWGFIKTKSYGQNLEDYIKLLNGKKNHDCRLKGCIAGESTPSYLFTTKRVPARIKQVSPWAKFIVVLRDPVKRAFSACNMLREKNEVKTSFRDHIKLDRKWMKKVGLLSSRI